MADWLQATPCLQVHLLLAAGEPAGAGTVIVVCYFLVAGLCGWALQVARAGTDLAAGYEGLERRVGDRAAAYRARRLFWGLLVVLFVLLGIGKQFDLHLWVTDLGRGMAEAQGWYERRTQFQMLFVLAMAVAGLATLTVVLRRTRDLLPRQVLAFFGLVLLAFFLAARISSFHDVDGALEYQILGLRVSEVMELSALVCVGASAVCNCWWVRWRRDGGAMVGDRGAMAPGARPVGPV